MGRALAPQDAGVRIRDGVAAGRPVLARSSIPGLRRSGNRSWRGQNGPPSAQPLRPSDRSRRNLSCQRGCPDACEAETPPLNRLRLALEAAVI
jgi:hypothetical protein